MRLHTGERQRRAESSREDHAVFWASIGAASTCVILAVVWPAALWVWGGVALHSSRLRHRLLFATVPRPSGLRCRWTRRTASSAAPPQLGITRAPHLTHPPPHSSQSRKVSAAVALKRVAGRLLGACDVTPSKGGGAPPHGPRGGDRPPPLIMPVENWNSRMKLFSPQLAGPYANLVTSPNGYFYRARLPVRSLSVLFSLSFSFSLPLLFALLGDLMNYALHDDFIEWLCFRD